jgi:hypothetical protein
MIVVVGDRPFVAKRLRRQWLCEFFSYQELYYGQVFEFLSRITITFPKYDIQKKKLAFLAWNRVYLE